MAFSMFSGQISPIAINFGSASVKLLQLSRGDKPALVAAAEIPIPEAMRQDQDRQFLMLQQEIPKALKSGRFKGKRVVTTVPSASTFIQHMQITQTEGVKPQDLVLAELQAKLGISPRGVVVRTIEVPDAGRGAQNKTEMICFAVAREIVMRYIDLLKKLRLEVVGVHTEIVAMVRAFDHINRRESDKQVTTMYVDMGWGGTRVAITHGQEIVFARYIQVGGRHFDQLVANTLHCDLPTARGHRLAMERRSMKSAMQRATSSDGTAILRTANARAAADAEQQELQPAGATIAPATETEERRSGQTPIELACALKPASLNVESSNVDMSELLDTITDELSMSLRYHRGLFPGRPVDRAIFLGGESRQLWLCQHVVKELHLPAQLGDPLARYRTDQAATPGLTLDEPQPGWAVPCGLCVAPTDL